MLIYPAINLYKGKCVGRKHREPYVLQHYDIKPLALALSYTARGAKYLHVLDLEGAQDGCCHHMRLIAKIKQETGLLIQSGGGILSSKQVVNLIANGIARVVIDSLAITHPAQVCVWLNEFGAERIAIALDVYLHQGEPRVVVEEDMPLSDMPSLWQVLANYQAAPLKHVLCNLVNHWELSHDTNMSLYQEIKRRMPALHVQAAGGINSLLQLRAFAELGLAGVVVGQALIEKAFTLERAITEGGGKRANHKLTC